MNTLEILKEQSKALHSKIGNMQEDLGDIQVAIRAIEERRANRPHSASITASPSVLDSGIRPRAASNG